MLNQEAAQPSNWYVLNILKHFLFVVTKHTVFSFVTRKIILLLKGNIQYPARRRKGISGRGKKKKNSWISQIKSVKRFIACEKKIGFYC